MHDYYNVNTCQLTNWLQKAITQGIEEVTLLLPMKYSKDYILPCSIFLDGCGNSIQYLYLSCCAFRPTVGFNCLRSLTKLHLYQVCITRDELAYLTSNCFALEKLELKAYSELIRLMIPYWLERLSCLRL
jgi:uncharacterized membrane protein